MLLHSVAAERASGALVELLIPFFPDHDQRDSAGCTALHRAANADAVRLLLAAGYDPNARDAQGRTPLQRAGGERAPLEIRELLLRAGSKP